jgi:SAM-dependent methyltransferase
MQSKPIWLKPITTNDSSPMIYHAPMYLFLEFYQHFVHLPKESPRPKVLNCAAGGRVPPLGLFYENGFDTWGIDLSEEALGRARIFETANGMQFHLQKGDMRQLPFLDQTFDLVYEFYSLVHLSHADIAVFRSSKARSENGTILLCTRTGAGLLFTLKPKDQQVMSFELHSLTCDQVDRVKYIGV